MRPGRNLALLVLALVLAATLSACSGGPSATPTPTAPATKLVLAPILEAAIVKDAGPPPRTLVRVISALPNGCHHFAGARVEHTSTEIRVTVQNTVPADAHVACTMIYGTHVELVDIGAGLVSGGRYTVILNGEKTLDFTAD
jgi:hypothetical protein